MSPGMCREKCTNQKFEPCKCRRCGEDCTCKKGRFHCQESCTCRHMSCSNTALQLGRSTAAVLAENVPEEIKEDVKEGERQDLANYLGKQLGVDMISKSRPSIWTVPQLQEGMGMAMKAVDTAEVWVAMEVGAERDRVGGHRQRNRK